MNIIGNEISRTRKIKGLTQEKLAELSKVNLRTIQRIENNENTPRGKTLSLICAILEIDSKELIDQNDNDKLPIGKKIINGIFLILLNLVLMTIFGFLTLDSNANWNSRSGAILLSFLIPFFITYHTRKMNGIERMLKFGFGFIFYITIVLIKIGFPKGIVTGLIPCLILALGMLYFGEYMFKKMN